MITRFVITLETRAAGLDAARAIRRLLKFAGRSCGLKVVDARERIVAAEAENRDTMTSPSSQKETRP